jgi:hypothetical protein
MVVAMIALMVALTGSAVAAQKLGLGALSGAAKDKTVGVGKLTYVTVTHTASDSEQALPVAQCPAGLQVIGGGIHLNQPGDSFVVESHPTSSNGWTGFGLFTAPSNTATVTAICAVARKVTGTPGS